MTNSILKTIEKYALGLYYYSLKIVKVCIEKKKWMKINTFSDYYT